MASSSSSIPNMTSSSSSIQNMTSSCSIRWGCFLWGVFLVCFAVSCDSLGLSLLCLLAFVPCFGVLLPFYKVCLLFKKKKKKISSSSSISGSNPPKYDVFLSFRGEDTRKGFRSHLDGALFLSGIVTFFDDRDLETGDEISSSLSNAIRSSSLSIIIFSQNYASSSWCLNELLEIIECYETRGQIILPIFYHVSPSDVRHQNGTYREAFAKHEGRFTQDKVQKWRAALEQVAGLSGSELMPDDKQLETEFIKKIVKAVLAKLNRISSADHLHPGLIGIRSCVETVEDLLCLDSPNFHMVGIWGMGGIGKTTIAKAVYNRIANQFKAVFLENVRNDATNGLNHLQEKLLSGILGEGNHNYMNDFTIRRLQSMKILIVIDNVDEHNVDEHNVDSYHK